MNNSYKVISLLNLLLGLYSISFFIALYVLGQRVYSSVEELFAGNNKINFDLRRLAAGTYSAVVTSDNQLYTKKIVITK